MSSDFHARLCGDCPCFYADLEDSSGLSPRARDPLGRVTGMCGPLGVPTTRTSWCQVPDEREQQQRAMAEYRGGGPGAGGGSGTAGRPRFHTASRLKAEMEGI